jgi:hypothetical protein
LDKGREHIEPDETLAQADHFGTPHFSVRMIRPEKSSSRHILIGVDPGNVFAELNGEGKVDDGEDTKDGRKSNCGCERWGVISLSIV